MESLEILDNLVKYKTIKGNTDEFEKAFNYIKILLPKELNVFEYNFNNNKSLVISNTDDKNLDIIFSTHIDVVTAKEENFQLHLIDNRIYGRGTLDMKGSIAVILTLLCNLKNVNKKIALFITSDEEHGGFYGTKELLNIYNTAFAIVPDGGKNFMLVKEEKGVLQLKISINTTAAHSSQLWNGDNAIVHLINLYNKLIDIYPLPVNENDYKTSINLSIINGGLAINKVPDSSFMILDIRHTASDAKDIILKNIKEVDPNVQIEVIAEGEVFATDLNNPLIKNYINITEKVINKKVDIISCESSSDARFFTGKNIPTIIMNPEGDYIHCDNEYITQYGLDKLYEIYEKIINN